MPRRDLNLQQDYLPRVGPKCPFPFDKIVVPSTAPLYPACKSNKQTHSGLARVCANGMYRSIGQSVSKAEGQGRGPFFFFFKNAV